MKNFIYYILFFVLITNNSHANLKIIIPKKEKQTQASIQKESTIHSVHKNLISKRYNCVQLITSYLKKIKKYDLALNRGAPLNTYAAINPSILQQAQNLDNYFAQHAELKGPLHCIPIIIKDNIDSIDTPSTSGSLALLGSQPKQDAVIVEKLKSAGAIIMGKGTMDEFASGLIGISSRSGRVGNAYDPKQNPGGSSSGPAVAVSTDLAMIGIGTDNSGSIRIPAAFNGIYGLRPSSDSLSKVGIFPRGNLDGVPGPMARNMQDLAIVYSVIQTPIKTESINNKTNALDSLQFLDKKALTNKRIGLIKSITGQATFNKENIQINKLFQQAIEQLKNMHATVVPVTLPKFNHDRAHNTAGEISDINNYLSSFASTRKSFTDICHSNRTRTFGNEKECLKYAIENPKPNSHIYQNVLKMFAENRTYIKNIMNTQHLDALLIPISRAGFASYDPQKINALATVSSNSGLPSVTIIAGYTENNISMPVGMELIGKMHAETEIINMAYAFEQASPTRQAPKLGEPDRTILSALNIPQLNNLFTQLGYESYKKILKDNSELDLTPDKFSEIVRSISPHPEKKYN